MAVGQHSWRAAIKVVPF